MIAILNLRLVAVTWFSPAF